MACLLLSPPPPGSGGGEALAGRPTDAGVAGQPVKDASAAIGCAGGACAGGVTGDSVGGSTICGTSQPGSAPAGLRQMAWAPPVRGVVTSSRSKPATVPVSVVWLHDPAASLVSIAHPSEYTDPGTRSSEAPVAVESVKTTVSVWFAASQWNVVGAPAIACAHGWTIWPMPGRQIGRAHV